MPVRLLRDRKESFVELNAYDVSGKSSYGTAGYLGHGYFVTVKHAVVALDDPDGREGRKITAIKVRVHGRDLAARLVDAGDADVEVHSGDWAIIRVTQPVDLPPLRVNTSFTYDFADPIFRLGQRLLEGHHPEHRLRGAADVERSGDVPDRWPPRRIRRRGARSGWRPRGDSDRPDAGRLSLLVHPAGAGRDVQESPVARDRGHEGCELDRIGPSVPSAVCRLPSSGLAGRREPVDGVTYFRRRSSFSFSHPSSRRLISFSNPRSVGL